MPLGGGRNKKGIVGNGLNYYCHYQATKFCKSNKEYIKPKKGLKHAKIGGHQQAIM